jgi:hypothetical protein
MRRQCATFAFAFLGVVSSQRRQVKVPLGGLTDDWLQHFAPMKKTTRSSGGRSNDPIVDAQRRTARRRRLAKAKMLPKGVPSSRAAQLLEASLKESSAAMEKRRGSSRRSANKAVEPLPRKTVLNSSKSAESSPSLSSSSAPSMVAEADVPGLASPHMVDRQRPAALVEAADADDGIDDAQRSAAPFTPLSLVDLLPAMRSMTRAQRQVVEAAFHKPRLAEALAQERGGNEGSQQQQLGSTAPLVVEMDHIVVTANSNVPASELDEMEARHAENLHRRVSSLPQDLFEDAYERKSPSSLAVPAAGADRASYYVSTHFGDPPRSSPTTPTGVNYLKVYADVAADDTPVGSEPNEMLDEGQNVHFPTSSESSGDNISAQGEPQEIFSSQRFRDPSVPVVMESGKDSTTDAKEMDEDVRASLGGAYYRRSVPLDLVPRTLSTAVWTQGPAADTLMQMVNAYDGVNTADRLAEGPMDCTVPDFNAEVTRRAHLKFLSSNPINEMIQEPFCRVVSVEPRNGDEAVRVRQSIIPTAEGRAMARRFGLDLIRTGTQLISSSDGAPDRSSGVQLVVAVCVVGDHREHLRRDVKLRLAKQGVNAPPAKPLIDVDFRGATHPFAIRHKVARIVRQLVRGAPARITLRDFGSPTEGFPVFQTILDEVKMQANEIKAFHRAGPITAGYDEISCFLLPSTAKSPKSSVMHPTTKELDKVKRLRQVEEQKEIHFDGYYGTLTAKERLQYAYKLRDGTAWAEQDEGLSLRAQRRLKIFQGFIPKGNKDLYSMRGDVNIPFPFKTNHVTTMEKWQYGQETNLDQSERASAVLGKRRNMMVSEMHDMGETEENPSVVDRFQYRMSGNALDVGILKESLGLKNNRKRVPMAAGPWGTLGLPNQEKSPFTTTK